LKHVVDADSLHREQHKDATNNLVRWSFGRRAGDAELVAFGNETVMALRQVSEKVTVAALNALGFTTADGKKPFYLGRRRSLDFRFESLATAPAGTSLALSTYHGSEQHVRVFFDVTKIEKEPLSAFQVRPFASNEAKQMLEGKNLLERYTPEEVVGRQSAWM